MTRSGKQRTQSVLIWLALAASLSVPIIAAALSPLLQWRDPIYIGAGFAGIFGLGILLVQPLLARGSLPGLALQAGRRVHRWTGVLLVGAVVLHVLGLWITSPPDVIDVLLLSSPTPFSVWGVVAMWAVFLSAVIALLRRRLRVRPKIWRRMHTFLALVIVIGTVVHAMLIEGTMEPLSKAVLCALVLIATLRVMADLKIWRLRDR